MIGFAGKNLTAIVLALAAALPACLVIAIGGALVLADALPFRARSLPEAAATEDFGEVRLRLGYGEDPRRRAAARLRGRAPLAITAFEGAVLSGRVPMIELLEKFVAIDAATLHQMRCFADSLTGEYKDDGMRAYLAQRDRPRATCEDVRSVW